MELMPHDMVEVRDVETLISSISKAPAWVEASLKKAPYVVVRRGPISREYIPIGIRGDERGQRFGNWISEGLCRQIIRPYTLIKQTIHSLVDNSLKDDISHLDKLFKKEKLRWGIGGSFGFSIASNVKMFNNSSDLDVLIYPQQSFDRAYAQQLLESINKSSTIRCDIQVQTKRAAFNLADYATNNTILLKTNMSTNLVDASLAW